MPSIDIATTFDWDTFVRRYWNKRPVLYQGTSASPFVPGDVFAAATGASRSLLERSAASGSQPFVQFTMDRSQQLFLDPWLPRESDGSLEAYDRRLAPRLEGRRYALIVARLHASGFDLWARERAFFSALWRRVGLPLTGGITTLFHGNYEHSPVGVHQDRFTTFLFALQGRKRMRFWPTKPWSAPVSTILDYEPYLKDSFMVEVGPGDILYWPASYYHVGESAGRGVATSVNVGIPISEHRTAYDVHDLLPGLGDEAPQEGRGASRRKAKASPLVRGVLSGDGLLPTRLPPALVDSVHALRSLSQRKTLERQLQLTRLKRLSAAGFEPVPRPSPRGRLTEGTLVRGEPLFPILLEREGEEGWLCSAHGHALSGSGRWEAVRQMVETLNSGEQTRVGELLRPFPSRGRAKTATKDVFPSTREGMRQVLERLWRFHVLNPA